MTIIVSISVTCAVCLTCIGILFYRYERDLTERLDREFTEVANDINNLYKLINVIDLGRDKQQKQND